MEIPIILQTAQGELVARATIPPFAPLPGLVLWGVRAFTLHDPGLSGAPPSYREALAAHVVDVHLPPA